MNRIFLYLLLSLPLSLFAQNTDLSGFISSELGSFVDNVEVSLFDSQGTHIGSTISVHGKYTFPDLPSNQDYTLQLSKSGSPLNGISTFDHVMIARHILAVEVLQGPNDHLAADVDGSGSVSVSDLIQLRGLILGIYEQLPQNRNWLFLADDQTPANPQQLNTFTFSLSGNSVLKNFTIMKIGDMNKNAQLD